MRHLLKRLLTPPLVVVAALLMLIEETLILGLQRLMAGLANLPWVAAVEARMARLPPYPAMVLFLLPALILLPVKLGAVWMIARGKLALGAGIIVAGKVIGTALAARVYKILHPTLATLPWFVRAEAWIFSWRDRLYAGVRAMPAWKAASVAVHVTRAWVAARLETLRRRMVRPGWMARRLAAIRRRARRSA